MSYEMDDPVEVLREEVRRKDIGIGLIKIVRELTERKTLPNEALDQCLELHDRFGELDEGPEIEEWPEPPGAAAYHGPIGQFAKLIQPHTEADPIAILGQLLVSFGSAVGRGPHVQIEADSHHVNEFLLVIGQTAHARKGTSLGHVKKMMQDIDSSWQDACIKSGLASGEGLIQALRDKNEDGPPAENKRLLVVEAEFGRSLVAGGRDGSTLTAVLRSFWDSDRSAVLTRSDPLEATRCHVSVIGHITEAELKRRMTEVDIHNGFLNRFFVLRVKRSQLLPHGGAGIDEEKRGKLAQAIQENLEFARKLGRVEMDAAAKRRWSEIYPNLSRDRDGLIDPLAARAEAHVLRLSLLYALADGASEIRIEHLQAAYALWDYSERSLETLFGDRLGNPVADKILSSIRAAGSTGLNREGLHRVLGNRVSSKDLTAALNLLVRKKRARKIGSGKGSRFAPFPRRSKPRRSKFDEEPDKPSSSFAPSQEQDGNPSSSFDLRTIAEPDDGSDDISQEELEANRDAPGARA